MAVCKKCHGYGYIQVDEGHYGMPQAIPCSCVLKKALTAQATRAWRGLEIVPVKRNSLLKGKVRENIVVVAHKSELMIHLRSALAHHARPEEFVKVVSDATLISAWLSNLARSDRDVIDPDYIRDLRVASLEDLAESPTLLIIRLGVKTARNSAMPEVLVETIELRQHLGKPTWLVVEPDKPLEEGHISWSRAVDDALDGWERITTKTTSSSQRKGGGLTIQEVSSNTAQGLPKARHKTMKL